MAKTELQPMSRVCCTGLLAGGETWNKCDVCGRFISMIDFDSGKAVRRMTTPDSDYSTEDYETLCRQHRAS